MQVLELRGNNLTGSIPNAVGTLSKLTTLNLSENALSGTIPANILSNLKLATSINLSKNELSGAVPSPVTMTRLTELNLSGNNLSTATWANWTAANFPALTTLNLSANSFSYNPIPAQLVTLTTTTVSTLNLSRNNFSGPFPSAWCTGNNRVLLNLDLSFNQISQVVRK